MNIEYLFFKENSIGNYSYDYKDNYYYLLGEGKKGKVIVYSSLMMEGVCNDMV